MRIDINIDYDGISGTGTVIPKDVMEKAVAEYSEKLKENPDFGFILDSDYRGVDGNYRLEKVSHIVRSVQMSEKGVTADIDFVGTGMGRTLESLIDLPGACFVPNGMVDTDGGEVKSFTITSIDFSLKKI